MEKREERKEGKSGKDRGGGKEDGRRGAISRSSRRRGREGKKRKDKGIVERD